MTEASRQFISTREAAIRLGVAVSTVQAWVETGALPAWKTAGGHRRIPVDAVAALLARQDAATSSASAPNVFKVLIVEDDPVQRELYRRRFTEWNLPLQLLLAEDGFEALLLVGRHTPDLIITDLAMPGMDGFMMIRRLKGDAKALSTMIFVVTGLTPQQMEQAGGIPDGIPVYPKPIPFPALRAVIEHRVGKRLAEEILP